MTKKKSEALGKAPPTAPPSGAPKKGSGKKVSEKSTRPEAPPPEPEPEKMTFHRDADQRPEAEAKAIRGLLKKAKKALDTIQDVLDAFEPAPERPVRNALKKIELELESLSPPEPRKCKEYKRSIALARKGEMGIHPDDVIRFCRCGECYTLREKAGLPHPLVPKQI